MKILLVDDSGSMRHFSKRILTGLGITDIKEAGDGLEAIKAANEEKPDLIMMDWNMPNMTGIEALKKLKADPATQPIPVIMVTSESEKANIIEAVKSGAANYVVKPFNADTIKEKIGPFLK
jgi:two-component system chemotaxis response regulator CheY